MSIILHVSQCILFLIQYVVTSLKWINLMFILGLNKYIFSQKLLMCTTKWENNINENSINKMSRYRNYMMDPNPILDTWSLNLNGGMPLVKGSAIINSVLMCSMTTLLSLTRSRMAKYLMSMCLLRLPLLLFLARNTTDELSQNILNGLDTVSKSLSPEMKLFNHTPCDVASKQETNSASIVEVAIKPCLTLL